MSGDENKQSNENPSSVPHRGWNLRFLLGRGYVSSEEQSKDVVIIRNVWLAVHLIISSWGDGQNLFHHHL
jgi:hypothetical protein